MQDLSRFIPDADLHDRRPATQLGVSLLETIIDEVSRLSGTWKQLTKQQQDESIGRMRARVYDIAADAAAVIAAAGRVKISVEVDSMAIKKETKAVLIIKEGKRELIEWIGRPAMLVFTDIEVLTEGMGEVEGEEDQRKLELDAGEDRNEELPRPTLAQRLLALSGIDLPDDHDFWQHVSEHDKKRIVTYVMQLEQGESDPIVPGCLGPFLPDDDAPHSRS